MIRVRPIFLLREPIIIGYLVCNQILINLRFYKWPRSRAITSVLESILHSYKIRSIILCIEAGEIILQSFELIFRTTITYVISLIDLYIIILIIVIIILIITGHVVSLHITSSHTLRLFFLDYFCLLHYDSAISFPIADEVIHHAAATLNTTTHVWVSLGWSTIHCLQLFLRLLNCFLMLQ